MHRQSDESQLIIAEPDSEDVRVRKGPAPPRFCSRRVIAGWVLAFIIVIIVIAIVHATRDGGSTTNYVTEEMRTNSQKIIDYALSAAQQGFVWKRLAHMCDVYGPRLSGTPALEAAIDDCVIKIREQDELDVWTVGEIFMSHRNSQELIRNDNIKKRESYEFTHNFTFGDEYAYMMTPRVKKLAMTGLGGSIGTGGVEITAPVVVVSSFDELTAKGEAGDVAGKIVVYAEPWVSYFVTKDYRLQGAKRAAQYQAVGALVSSITPFSMQTPHTGTSQTATIPFAAITPEDAMQMQRLDKAGYPVSVRMYMEAQTMPDRVSRNVIMELKGSEYPDQYVIIGGHIDSWDNAEGAMDDGGGCFIMWEAVRMLKELNIKPKRTIRAVFWVNEENGMAGAYDYAARYNNTLANVSFAMESDEGQWQAWRLNFNGSDSAYAILQQLASLQEPLGSTFLTRGGLAADVSPLHDQGVPCGTLEVLDPRETPWANNPCSDVNGRTIQNPIAYDGDSDGYFWYHHTATDTVDKLAPEDLQRSSASMAVWAYSIAMLDDLLPRK